MSKIKDHKGGKWRSGDHLIVCDRTGRVIYASDARKEWNGKWVHKDWWEPKHPSLIFRDTGVDKSAAPQPVRLEPTDTFIDNGIDQVYEADVYSLLDGVYE